MADIRLDFPDAGSPTTTLLLDPSLASITRKRVVPHQVMQTAISGREWVLGVNVPTIATWTLDFAHVHEADDGSYAGFASLDTFIQSTLGFHQLPCTITDPDGAVLIARYTGGLPDTTEGGGRDFQNARSGQFFGALQFRQHIPVAAGPAEEDFDVTTITSVNSSDGAPFLTSAAAFPADGESLSCVAEVMVSFSTENGLTGIALGDPDEGFDIWTPSMGILITNVSNTGDHNLSGKLFNPTPRAVQVTALGGDFGATGQLRITTLSRSLTPQ